MSRVEPGASADPNPSHLSVRSQPPVTSPTSAQHQPTSPHTHARMLHIDFTSSSSPFPSLLLYAIAPYPLSPSNFLIPCQPWLLSLSAVVVSSINAHVAILTNNLFIVAITRTASASIIHASKLASNQNALAALSIGARDNPIWGRQVRYGYRIPFARASSNIIQPHHFHHKFQCQDPAHEPI